MAKSLRATIWGSEYQARHFWRNVCHLFFDETGVTKVAMEVQNVKSLDDVAVFYRPGIRDELGEEIKADYHQVKFHVRADGACTWKGLMDPAFINATSFSLLQRLRNAQLRHAPEGKGCRFILYTPWQVHPDDELGELYVQGNGSLDWSKLADGGERSAMGKIRAAWKSHLEIADDAELQSVLRPLRLLSGPTLAELGEALNWRLRAIGLRAVGQGQLVHPYDDLYQKLVAAGRTEFTRQEIEQLCRDEDLWGGDGCGEIHRLGIRSFLRGAERLGDETDALLCLLEHFEGRHPKSPDLWPEMLVRVQTFLADAPQRGKQHHLYLDTHASIAFAAGYFLDTKAGFDVVPIQSSMGKEVWRPPRVLAQGRYPQWTMVETAVPEAQGHDVAVSLGASRDILEDVRRYVAGHLPEVRRILSFSLPSGAGSRSVVDGAHAKLLADELSRRLQTGRTAEERDAILHVFPAVPNGLIFFLGQLSRGFRRCRLYEFDFEGERTGSYQPSLSFPPPLSVRLPNQGPALAVHPEG